MNTIPVSHIFEEDDGQDQEYSSWAEKNGALASFILDYEYLKNLHGFSQEEIAVKAGTTQSAISRLVRMKGKPTYNLLKRVSETTGGELEITPLGEYSVTLKYELHETAQRIAKEKNIEVSELLRTILNQYFENQLALT